MKGDPGADPGERVLAEGGGGVDVDVDDNVHCKVSG